ncbi:SYVM protein, partial [Tyrannus savana]|nr:SYVM protein [Tyrannus savana]
MSKSLGNVIDPRDIIGGATLQRLQFPQGIPTCGADALRLALLSQNCQGAEIRVDVGEVLSQRRFCNKVWNGLRFVLGVLGDLGGEFQPPHPEQVVPGGPMERWVLSRLAGAVSECGRRLECLEFHGALAAVQHFWLRSFCDVFLVGGTPF